MAEKVSRLDRISGISSERDERCVWPSLGICVNKTFQVAARRYRWCALFLVLTVTV